AGERPAGREVEVPFVAGAVEAAALDLREDRAGEVGAALVEGDHLARGQPDEQLPLAGARVVELPEAADRQLVEAGDRRLGEARAPAEQALGEDPRLSGDEREAGENEELGELAAGDVLVLRHVDRKVAPPPGLFVRRPAV